MNRRLIILITIAAGCLLLACSASQLAPRTIVQVSVTPVRTLRPTFTPTNTPTSTDIPTATFTPTPTPTATPVPTDTPLPTDTPPPTNTLPPSPTSPPTDTPSPTTPPTATKRPTPRPTRPPTATPKPLPTNTPAPAFTAKVVRGFARCDGYRGIEGHVKHGSGAGFGGVSIGVWSDTWVGAVTQSEPDGKYAFNLSNLPPGTFKVAVVRPESCAMQDVLTAFQCTYLSTPISIAITENCTGAGASQVTVLDFTGP